ncbi:hypothetical protein [Arthrobacter oryzae]|nr:hypothetical protein [Arthrobacter oryzae]MDQ0076841.1 hypothetical protein [Arthrobacter oryzae]
MTRRDNSGKYDGGQRLGCGGYASRPSRWNARAASMRGGDLRYSDGTPVS